MSSCRQGVVEVLFRAGPIFPGGDDLLHLDAVFVDALDLLIRAPQGGVVCDGGLDDEPDLHHFPGVALHGAETADVRTGGVDTGGGDIGAPAPADLHQAAGAENADGLP